MSPPRAAVSASSETILGRGRRLFPDGIDRLKLRLADTRKVGPDGVQIHVYELL